jgi:hypothetical protein
MIRLPKSALALAGVVLAVGALTLAVPRAAHAIAATLVQVANTASNPAVTQNVSGQAAQLVYLNTNLLPNSSKSLYQFGPGLYDYSGYTVPAGQSLVITAADLLPASTGGCLSGQFTFILYGNSPVAAQVMWTVSAPNIGHFEYPSGIVFGPGSSPGITFSYASTTSGNCGNGANVNLFGYLTNN